VVLGLRVLCEVLSQVDVELFMMNSLRGLFDHQFNLHKLDGLTANAGILSDDCPLAPAIGAMHATRTALQMRGLLADRWIGDRRWLRRVHVNGVVVGIEKEMVLASGADAFSDLRIRVDLETRLSCS
jgi:hypothetical protein